MWTLDGLHVSDRELLFEALHDATPVVSSTALRLLEPFAINDKVFRKKLGDELNKMMTSASSKQLLQFVLSARYLDTKESFPIFKYALASQNSDLTSEVIKDAVISGLSGRELALTKALFNELKWENPGRYGLIVFNDLSTAIIKRRNPEQISELFELIHKDDHSSPMLTSIATQGHGKWIPLTLKSQPAVMNDTGMEDWQRQAINNMFEWPGHKVDREALKASNKLPEDQQELFASGRQLYLSVCSGCHGTSGEGVQRMAPPLVGSEWVLGDERRLALLVLHGIEGPIEVGGKRYTETEIQPQMPSHSTMDDGKITSILVYIRNEWGNDAGGVNRRIVGRLRHTTQGRVQPWTMDELNEHMEKIDTVKSN
jgi:mono/diheme cytochrome c family protein